QSRAREHRYIHSVPTRRSSDLVMGKSSAIGLYSLDRETFQNQFITLMISGLMDEATAHDLNLMLFATQRLQTAEEVVMQCRQRGDRKSTRLNSSHVKISYAVFC